MTERIGCCIDGCKRTDRRDKFDEGIQEIICAKCWGQVPQVLKARYRLVRKRWRKINRLIVKHQHDGRAINAQLWRMHSTIVRLENRNWQAIKDYMNKPDEPLDDLPGFLAEMGLL